MLNGVVSLILRFIQKRTFRLDFYHPFRQFTDRNRKFFYRSIDWIYKITMYPNIYFSLYRLINNSSTTVLNDEKLLNYELVGSVIIISIYTIDTICFYFLEETSKFSKYDRVSEIVFNIISSIVIIMNVYDSKLLILILIILGRGIFHIMIEKYLKRGRYREKYEYRIPIIVSEVLSIIFIYVISWMGALFFIILTVVLSLLIKAIQ